MLHMTAELIPPFTGQDKTYSVSRWIQDVEDNAEIFGWSTLQQLLIARRSLTGTAALWLRAERPFKSWEDLKNAIAKEFPDTVDMKTIHEMMSARKKKHDEPCLDYMLVMKELGKRGKMPDYVAIKYIIDGIIDAEINKMVLYGVTSYGDLKERLRTYETIKEKTKSHNQDQRRSRPQIHTQVHFNQPRRKCYNCGDTAHLSAECPNKRHGTKCFRCNSFGHLARECNGDNGLDGARGGRGASGTANTATAGTSGMKWRRDVGNTGAKAMWVKFHSENGETERANSCLRNNSTANEVIQCENETRIDTLTSLTVNKAAHGRRPTKNININKKTFQALIDSGSDVNLIRVDSFCNNLHGLSVEKCDTVFSGLGAARVQALGRFRTMVCVDDNSFKNILFYIVPNNAMSYSIILGQPFLENVVMILDNNNALFLPSNEEWMRNLACVVSLDVVGGEVSSDAQQQARYMMESYTPVKTKEAPIELRIILKDDVPVAQRPRRLALKEQDEVNKQISKWFDDGIIRVSHSEYSSPLVLVKKKDGSVRICVDYRLINAKMVKDEYPLPIIDDLIDRCKSGKIFSALDLKNGYFHMRVHEDSVKYTAFVTPTGQYEFLRAPFGLTICPKVFTRFINIIFRDLVDRGIVLIFIDDLLIPAENEHEAIERLSMVLQRASEYGLEINWKKCQLLVKKVEYLGHEIENGEVRPSPEKTNAVARFPEPQNVKQLQSFVGLCSYFRKFIQNFAMVAQPLTDLLKKNVSFKFNEEQRRSFAYLKEVLVTKPVLKIYNPRLHTELHTDASCTAYAAILMQKSVEDNELHPVHYMSRKTTDAQSKYTSYELEALAIIEGIKKFRHYLFGIKFKIVTDCKAFQMTINKKDLAMSTRVARWIIFLQDYEFTIEHREGSKMKHTDALSRNPYVSAMFSNLHDDLRYAQENDEKLKAIREILKLQPYQDYLLDSDLLYKGEEKKLVVPRSMENGILKEVHSNGHFSKKKMLELIGKDYYIENLNKKIEDFIVTCIPCLLATRKEGKQEGFLNPIEKQGIPLHTIHVDHIGPMTETKKLYNYILTVVDAFTKFTWIFPTKSTTSKEALEKLKIHQQHFGNPCRIITDKGTAFTSGEFKEFCREEGIQHVTITTGVPRGNGQVERVHRTIISVLTKLCIENPTLWYRHVSRLQRALNSTYQRSIDTSPFELFVGSKMKTKGDIEIYDLLSQEDRSSYVENREELRRAAKQQILKIQEENMKSFNKRRKRSSTYQPGTVVAIKRTQFGVGMKLKPKFLGPYRVVRIKGNDRYDVEKMDTCTEGPRSTSTSADFMKIWPDPYSNLVS